MATTISSGLAEGVAVVVMNDFMPTEEADSEEKKGELNDEQLDHVVGGLFIQTGSVTCPKCGKMHDVDWPKCPFCKHDYYGE